MKFDVSFSKIILLLLILILCRCQSNPDFIVLRSELLDLHQKTISAHRNKDVDFLMHDLSENFLSVSNGEVSRPTKEEMRSRFSRYLNSTSFTEYHDLSEPLVGFSKDGSLAWTIVQVKVAGKRKMDDESEKDIDFTCAWITLYERQGNKWVRFTEVSNFK